MARFLIIGASSGIGLETVKAMLAAGHAVRAFARSARRIEIDDPYLEKVDGDARDAEAISRALSGSDCVVQSLGVALSPGTLFGGTTLFSTATRALVSAMEQNGPKRLIVVTGLGAGDSRDAMGPLYRAAFEFSLRPIYDDKDVQEVIVRRSALDWTLVRPGFLTDQPKGSWKVITAPGKSGVSGSIGRADVAAFIAKSWNDASSIRTAPILVS